MYDSDVTQEGWSLIDAYFQPTDKRASSAFLGDAGYRGVAVEFVETAVKLKLHISHSCPLGKRPRMLCRPAHALGRGADVCLAEQLPAACQRF